MPNSQPPPERDDASQPVSATPTAKAKAADIDSGDLGTDRQEIQFTDTGTKVADPTAVDEEHSSELSQSIDRGNDDEQEASETVDFAVSLMEQCKADLSLPNLDSVVFIFRQVLDESTSTHRLRFDALCGLFSALGLRFVHTKDPEDLMESLELGKRIQETKSTLAIFSSDDNDSDAKEMLEMAQMSLTDLYKSTSLSTIDTAVFLLQQSLSVLPPGRSKRHIALTNLAYGTYMRFHHSNDISDLHRAISMLEGDAQVYTEDEQDEIDAFHQLLLRAPVLMDNSSISATNDSNTEHAAIIQSRDDDVSEVEEDVSLLDYALDLIEEFSTSGRIHDLDNGIALTRSGLAEISVGSPTYSTALLNLAVALLIRFEHKGGAQDLDESISLNKQTLQLFPPSHPNRSSSLNNLANALRTRFERQGDAQDLNQSISFNRQALELFPPSHPNHYASLSNLAVALLAQFKLRGDAQDLDESISLLRQALELRHPSHKDRSGSLTNLANALQTRFDHRGWAKDLDECISVNRQALKFFPPPHPNRSNSLNNLANALRSRSEQQGQAQDLDESILLHKQALELRPPPHPNRSLSLNNLATALQARFERQRDIRDLDESVSFFRQALELFPPSHPNRPGSLTNLASTLIIRFDQRGDAKDLDESISFHIQALDLFPPFHPGRSTGLNNFGGALLSQFEHQGKVGHLEQAIQIFSEAAHSFSQPLSVQFQEAKVWASLADLCQHTSAIEAFGLTLDLLPQLAALNLDIQSRQDSMTKGTDGLARKAASCAIRAGNVDKALEFLETGRCVFWSQFLSLRSPVDSLHDIAPQLATDLRRISQELENKSHRDQSIENMNNKQKLLWEQEAQRFERLAKEWKDTVNKVRDLEGFEDFLQPERLSKLQTAAKGGPIIYLVANDDASNCLIVTSTQPAHHILLPNLPLRVLSELVKLVQIAASPNQMPRSIEGIVETWADLPQPTMEVLQRWMVEEERGTWQRRRTSGLRASDDVFKYVLRVLWDEAVKPVIDFLDLKKSGDHRPTLTWCTTGLFTFLPVHAAGRYEGKVIDCASEYIISSYTPTIGALLVSNPPPVKPFQMMAVIQSQTLPSTREELEKIEQHVAANSLIKFGIEDAQASVEAVASHLSSAAIVHFACHGIQDSGNPLHSGLEIEGKRLTISRIMKESVPNSALAFLCACETAMGDEKIPDEAMSIGASLLFAGFQSIIATMWRMADDDGPVIADTFYKELFKGPDGNSLPLPDTSKSAYALAIAVNELRSRGVEFRRWVPFIHMGK